MSSTAVRLRIATTSTEITVTKVLDLPHHFSHFQSASKRARQLVSESVAVHRIVRVCPVLTFVRSAQRVPQACSTQADPTRHSVPAVSRHQPPQVLASPLPRHLPLRRLTTAEARVAGCKAVGNRRSHEKGCADTYLRPDGAINPPTTAQECPAVLDRFPSDCACYEEKCSEQREGEQGIEGIADGQRANLSDAAVIGATDRERRRILL